MHGHVFFFFTPYLPFLYLVLQHASEFKYLCNINLFPILVETIYHKQLQKQRRETHLSSLLQVSESIGFPWLQTLPIFNCNSTLPALSFIRPTLRIAPSLGTLLYIFSFIEKILFFTCKICGKDCFIDYCTLLAMQTPPITLIHSKLILNYLIS